MKNLKDTINEQLVTEASRTILYQVQADHSKGAAYSTFDINDARKGYKHGFLSYSQYDGIVFTVAFNTIEDLQDLLDTDDDEYSSLLNMKPQDTKIVNGELFIKLW